MGDFEKSCRIQSFSPMAEVLEVSRSRFPTNSTRRSSAYSDRNHGLVRPWSRRGKEASRLAARIVEIAASGPRPAQPSIGTLAVQIHLSRTGVDLTDGPMMTLSTLVEAAANVSIRGANSNPQFGELL